MLEWLIAGAVFVVALLALPRLLTRAKAGAKRGGGGGMIVALGLIFASAFDPARAAATEELDLRKETDGTEEGESGGEP
ncbi:hypothetical protein GRI89_03725 [Altererythrobacter salegens]|uniref:Uncharacterized protein n=1 Tax=Croceibacterium salegens TaxID=1737568 RepID=A0A6I4SUI5_9SPHN|nr:hypothetical protein [Croceibacterium salegens]MXO58650.1 hypothetical protein [Croceibacterium salegens]